MAWLRQTFAVMLINLQTIPSRLGSSAVAIIGIAGVVIVLSRCCRYPLDLPLR